MKDKSNLRPCIVDGQKSWFHCWESKSDFIPPSPRVGGHSGGVIAGVLGIIEREDGTVHECYPIEIRFLDNEPVKNGIWEFLHEIPTDGYRFRCSVCHGELTLVELPLDFKYCPLFRASPRN